MGIKIMKDSMIMCRMIMVLSVIDKIEYLPTGLFKDLSLEEIDSVLYYLLNEDKEEVIKCMK
jgi:hypothetical protein